MVERAPFHAGTTERTVMRHGAWTRVDNADGPRRATTYYAADGGVEIGVYRNDTGVIDTVSFRRGSDAGWDIEARNTGERATVLGESCALWHQTFKPGRVVDVANMTRVSCVTDDGIELSYRIEGSFGVLSSVEATRIARRPVATDEVRPPREVLDVAWWDGREVAAAAASAGPMPDFEVVMQAVSEIGAGSADRLTRTTRRHFPWTLVEETAGETRRKLVVTNAATGLSIEFAREAKGGSERLLIAKYPPSLSPLVPSVPRTGADRHADVLGEGCDWFDTSPAIMDAGRGECRTPDGLVLMEDAWSRGGYRHLIAVRVSREPVEAGAVLPPAGVLDPKIWGLD